MPTPAILLCITIPSKRVMAYNTKFGPGAQTPEQRAWVLEQMQEILPSLKTRITVYVQQCYDRYIAGEFSWQEMRQAVLTGQS